MQRCHNQRRHAPTLGRKFDVNAKRELKTITERNARAVRLRPAMGQGTAVTIAQSRTGQLACDICDGDWRLVSDADAGEGGEALGPDPGVLVRAGLGACLAIGYRMWAARMDVAFESIEVRVEADYDARGMYGVDDAVTPGWRDVRVAVNVTSDAPPDRVRAVVEAADGHSPILDDLTRARTISRTLNIGQTTAVRE